MLTIMAERSDLVVVSRRRGIPSNYALAQGLSMRRPISCCVLPFSELGDSVKHGRRGINFTALKVTDHPRPEVGPGPLRT
jgi:hypothetical protein